MIADIIGILMLLFFIYIGLHVIHAIVYFDIHKVVVYGGISGILLLIVFLSID